MFPPLSVLLLAVNTIMAGVLSVDVLFELLTIRYARVSGALAQSISHFPLPLEVRVSLLLFPVFPESLRVPLTVCFVESVKVIVFPARSIAVKSVKVLLPVMFTEPLIFILTKVLLLPAKVAGLLVAAVSSIVPAECVNEPADKSTSFAKVALLQVKLPVFSIAVSTVIPEASVRSAEFISL